MSTYYVADVAGGGSDSNSGLSELLPWLTVAKVNGSTFSPGDSILFKKGCTWRERLIPPSSGSVGNPITFGAYGTGDLPIISGADDITAGPWTQATTGGGSPTGTVVNQLDDAHELTGGALTDSFFETVGFDATTIGGIVFNNLAVPKDATINSAKITFTCGNSLTTDTVNLRLYGENTAAPAAFVDKTDFDSRKANLTGNYANWSAIEHWEAGTHDSPDISGIIDEITSLASWANGNNICIFVKDNGSTESPHAYRQFNAKDATHSTGLAVLSVTYAGTPIANVYYTTAVAADPGTVWFDGVSYSEAASAAAVNSTNRWFWSSGDSRLYVYATSDPGGFYTLIEAPNASRVNALACSNRSYITIQNIEFQRAYNTTFYLLGTATHWIVQDCLMTGAGNTATLRIKETANYNTIQRCTITGDNKCGVDTVKISDTDAAPTVGTIFQNNTVTNAMHTVLAVPNASTTTCQYNYVKNDDNTWGRTFAVENGDGVGGNIIRYNWFEGSYASEDYAQDGNKFNGDGNEFYGNVVCIGNDSGLQMSLYTLEGLPLVAQNNKVYNNIFYGFEGGPLWGAQKACISIYDGGLRSPAGNEFKNNIIFGADGTNHYQVELLAGSTLSAYIFANNCIYDSTTTSTVYDGGAARTVAYMEANHAVQWSSNVVADPLFTNAAGGDFTLQAGSPCRNAGVDLGADYANALAPGSSWPGGVVTKDQRGQGPGWEIGAYVFGQPGGNLVLLRRHR